MYPLGQVQTGLSLPFLSKPGVQSALVPHGLGLQRSSVGVNEIIIQGDSYILKNVKI